MREMEENKRENRRKCEKKEDHGDHIEKAENSTKHNIKRQLSAESAKQELVNSEEDSDEESEDELWEPSATDNALLEEELIDKGEDADSESDDSTVKQKRAKKNVKKKKKEKKLKMKITGALFSGDLKRRIRTQPNKRKKIRKIFTENKLQEETLQALRDEEERQKRLGLFTKDERREDEPFKFLEEENISTFPELSCDFNFEEFAPADTPNLEFLQTPTPDEIEPVLSSENANVTTPTTETMPMEESLDNMTAPSHALHLTTPTTLAPPSSEFVYPVTKSDVSSTLAPTPVEVIPPTSEQSLPASTSNETVAISASQAAISATSAAFTQVTPQFFPLTSSGQTFQQQAERPLPTIPVIPWQHSAPPTSARQIGAGLKNSSEVICISSESSEDESKKKTSMTSSKPIATETINISSGTESSDDVIFAGNDDQEIVQEDPDVNNSGMHVNDAMNQPDQLGRVLVNKNRPPGEPEIYLSPRAAKAVKPHQIGGIRFMFDNIVESLEHYKKSSGFGCILAHSMGLGKTLQAISFIEVFLRYTGATTALCVVPVNTLLNWDSEFRMWLSRADDKNDLDGGGGENEKKKRIEVRLLSDINKTTESRARVIAAWKKWGGVLVMGYEMFRLLTNQKQRKRRKRKSKKHSPPNGIETIDLDEEDRISELTSEVYENLVKPGPDLIVCDEGHRIKNSHASISQALKQVATRRRIVLTGYPLQNNLLEYWCMVDFVRPNFLGTRQEFSNMFERPISNGQCADSNESDIRLMRFRSHVLHSLLKGFVQRRSHVVLHNSLPPKEEHVLMLRFSPWQKKLYNGFIKIQKENGSGSWCSALNPIKAFSICCKVWNHPDVLHRAIALKTLEEQQSNEGLLDADLDLPDAILENVLGKNRRKRPEGNADKSEIGKLIQSIGLNPFGNDDKDKGINYEWAKELMQDYPTGLIELSGKMLILMQIIHHSVASGDKILVFSQSLTTLTLIEEFLSKRKVPNQPTGPLLNRIWAKNESYYRLDGNTNTSAREKMIQNFNSKDNNLIHVFLLSTRAGCLGINLVGANRVVIFDISWNPCHDAQAVCRVYRYGQTKRCIIYRLICDQSMEKKIYDRQISKQGMSDRVVDELNPIQSLERQDVAKLLIYDDEELPVPDLSNLGSQDETLRSVCEIYGSWLTRKPFFHESLLMNCEGTRLTKAEKRAAEKGYEQEKLASSSCNYSRPSYANFYAAAGYPKKTTAGPNESLFTKSSSTAPTDRPVANVRPVQSTPYPMRVGASAPLGTPSGDMQIIAHLERAGIEVKKGIATQDIPLPQSSGSSSKPLVAAGESYFMIRGEQGQYIGTTTGRIFALRTQTPEPRQTFASSLIKTSSGHMITSRERESQIIKTAFNSMIQRNPAPRQPIRAPYIPQQPIRAPENYTRFPQQNYPNKRMPSPIIFGYSNFMKLKQKGLNQQNQVMTQQNQVLTQQHEGLTQQNQVMTQQNQVLTQQDEEPTQQNQGQTWQNQAQAQDLRRMLSTTQTNLGLTQQNQGLTLQNQQNTGLTQQAQGSIHQNPGLSQLNHGLTHHNQGLTQQGQGLTQQNQGLTHHNQVLTQQNQGRTHQSFEFQKLFQENSELSEQNQGMSQQIQKQGMSQQMQNQGMNQQNQGMNLQLPNQGMSQQNQGMNLQMQNQGMSQQSQGMNLQMQNLGMGQQNLGMSQQDLGMSQQDQGMSQQNQGMIQQNQGMIQQNPGMIQQNEELSLQDCTLAERPGQNLPPSGLSPQTSELNLQNSVMTLGLIEENSDHVQTNPGLTQQLGNNQSSNTMLQKFLEQQNLMLAQQHFQTTQTSLTTHQTQNVLSQQGVPIATAAGNPLLSLNNNFAMVPQQVNSVAGLNHATQPASSISITANAVNPIVSQQLTSINDQNPIVSQHIPGTDSQLPDACQQFWNINEQEPVVTQQNEMMTQQHINPSFVFTEKLKN